MAFGDFTVSRAGTKWVLNSSGVLSEVAANVPAFEFNADGTYRGLLVEPAGTNLALRSQEFDNASWGKEATSSITATNAIAPDGTATADTYTQDVTPGTARIQQPFTVSSGATVSASIWVKRSVGDHLRMVVIDSASATRGWGAWFNLSNGTVGTSGDVSTGTFVSASIEAYPNSWYRVTIVGSISAVTGYQVSMYVATADASVTRLSNGAIILWGAQLETGSVATSYIPTVASTANRVADSVTLTGASSLIGQTEGTVYAEGFITNFGGATDSIFTISDGTVSNRIEVNKRSPNTIALERVSAIQSGATTISSGALSTGLVRIAIAYKTGDTAIFINGVQAGATSTATFTMPTIGNLVLGANATAGTRFWNSNVRALVLLPTRLTNAQLQALTA